MLLISSRNFYVSTKFQYVPSISLTQVTSPANIIILYFISLIINHNTKLWTGCKFPQTITIPLAVTQLCVTDCLYIMKYFKCFERCELCTAICLNHGRTSTSVTQFLLKVPEVSIWHLALRCTYRNLNVRSQRCSEAQ